MASEIVSFVRSLTSSGSTSIDSRRQVLTRLKFIGSIGPHEKIDSKSLVVESGNFLTPLRRLLSGDSRKSTLNVISNTIDRAFEIIDSLLYSDSISDRISCCNILQDLKNCIKGIQSIQVTYEDDKMVVSELNVIIENITSKLFSIKKTNPNLAEFLDDKDKDKDKENEEKDDDRVENNEEKEERREKGRNRDKYDERKIDDGLYNLPFSED